MISIASAYLTNNCLQVFQRNFTPNTCLFTVFVASSRKHVDNCAHNEDYTL